MTLQEPLISVIVPVYKVEEYIHKCVDSILNQTYKNLEIILVDDGSPDRCPEICDEYAVKDARVVVIHKENGGLSDARNAALDICKGDYITFVDSDDWVGANYVKSMYDALIKYKADISICRTQKISSHKDFELVKERNEDLEVKFDSSDALESMLYQKFFNFSACGKLYKAQLFRGVRYPLGKLSEDNATIYKIVHHCKNIIYSNNTGYFYCRRPHSIVTSLFTVKKMDTIYVAYEILDFIQKNYSQITKSAICHLVSDSFFIYLQIPIKEQEYKQYRKEIKSNILAHRKTVLLDKKAKLRVRVACAASYFGMWFVRFIWSIFTRNIFKSLKPDCY
jgi:glycosyltransferase involved in cell wall biosynthesis